MSDSTTTTEGSQKSINASDSLHISQLSLSSEPPPTQQQQQHPSSPSPPQQQQQQIKTSRNSSVLNGSTMKDRTAAAAAASLNPSLEDREKYRSPLVSRYLSAEMSYNFSEIKKFSTWRRLWFWLAKCQKVFYSKN